MNHVADIDEQLVAQIRAQRLADTANGGDDDLNSRIDEDGFPTDDESGLLVDRKDRPYVAYYQAADGSSQPYAIKEGDSLRVADAFDVYVIGAARDRHYVACVWPEGTGYEVIPIQADAFTDRAPADENETPWPIRPEEVAP